MSMPWREFEDEFEGEFELEGEYEGEYEGEQMIGRLSGFVQRIGRRLVPSLVRIMVTNPLNDPALPPPQPPPPIVRQDDRRGSASAPPPRRQREFEGEFGRRTPNTPAALMTHLGRAAAAAESEDEAEAFIGALMPLAAQLVPRAAPTLMRAAPQLIRGLAQAADVMRRNPHTRPLVRTLPTIALRTAQSIAHRAQREGMVPPQTVERTLERQTAYVLGTPEVRQQAIAGNLVGARIAARRGRRHFQTATNILRNKR